MTNQTNPLASTLPVPERLQELAPGLWPQTAERDDEGALRIEGIAMDELAERFGTPLLVLSESEVRDRATAARVAFDTAAARIGTATSVYYAGKALLTTAVARWVTEAGLGIDVCSGGELRVALAAGVDAARLGFHGNNKLADEIDEAVAAGVGTIIIDSRIEVDRIARAAAHHGVRQRVRLRASVGVHAETHHFLATSHEDQKFGIPLAEIPGVVRAIRADPALEFVGLHCHIGSQIFDTAGHRAAAERLITVHAALLEDGPVPELNLGGGFGIAYLAGDDPQPFDLVADDVCAFVELQCRLLGIPVPHLAFEPGRSIVGTAGVTLYRVGTIKPVEVRVVGTPTIDHLTADDTAADETAIRTYVSVDGGMSDNARYALYGAQYTAALANRAGSDTPMLTRLVGRHCESGDIVVDQVYLPADLRVDDLVAVPATAAYTVGLSSNYNYLPRPAIVAVREGTARTMVRRETIADLLARDVGVDQGA